MPYRSFREVFEPNAPPPLPSYTYSCRELCDIHGNRVGTEYTLYGPAGHEGNAHDWLITNVIGGEAFSQRTRVGKHLQFRYIVTN